MLKHLLRRLFPVRILSSLDAYARWAASYPPHAHNPLMKVEERAMTSLLPDLTGKVVLDLACGTGRYGLLAQQRGAKTVLALDNSPPMLHANPLPLRVLSTTEAIPLPDASVAVLLCALALGHLPHLEPSLREISRVLRPGGVALLSDFHPLLYLNGARRTFTAPDGRTYAVEHHVHLYADYHAAARASGLLIDAVLEPPLESAPPSTSFPTTPVVLVLRLIKLPVSHADTL